MMRREWCGNKTDLTEAELACLRKYLSLFEKPTYLEIGVYFGGSFAHVLNYLKENKTDFKAYGLDLFEDLVHETGSKQHQAHDIRNKWSMINAASRDELDYCLQQKGLKNYYLLRGQSHETVQRVPVRPDVYFLDGNHTYEQTKKDVEACLEKAKIGSYVILHNASKDIPPDPEYVMCDGGPWRVAEELKKGSRCTYVELVDRCAVLKVIK